MQKNERHLPILDCFRGVAILSVLGIHLFSGLTERVSGFAHFHHNLIFQALFLGLSKVLDMGGYGVAIFFVVSGFCIHLSHSRSATSGWMTFYIRRIFRLYPAYIISLFLCIFVFPFTRWNIDWVTHDGKWLDLTLHFFLIYNIVPQTLASIQGPYWSLAIEFQLYLLFPLLLLIVRQLGWNKALLVTAFIELISRLYLGYAKEHESNLYPGDWWGWMDLSPFGFWFSWSLGAALANSFLTGKTIPFYWKSFPLLLWPLVIFASRYLPYLGIFTFPLTAFGTFQFMAYYLSRNKKEEEKPRRMLARILSFFGIISYSLYLFHVPVFESLMIYFPKAHGSVFVYSVELLWTGASFLFTIIISYLSFKLIEMPGIEMGKNLIGKLRKRNFTTAV